MRGEWPANLLWSVTLNRSTLVRRRSETVISGHLCSGSGAGAAAFNDGYLESVRTSAFGAMSGLWDHQLEWQVKDGSRHSKLTPEVLRAKQPVIR